MIYDKKKKLYFCEPLTGAAATEEAGEGMLFTLATNGVTHFKMSLFP